MTDSLAKLKELAQHLQGVSRESPKTIRGGGGPAPPGLVQSLNETGAGLQERLDAIAALDVSELAPKKRVYIPVLRGLRSIPSANPSSASVRVSVTQSDPFKYRTLTDYFDQKDDVVEVFTGQTLYEDVKAHLLGHREERERIREYEEFLSDQLFNGREVVLIPRRDSDVLVVKIGDSPEYPIYDLGDGIQSVIILTYALFTMDSSWFFIEEPEMFLHPGLQRKLLEVLLSEQRNHRTFLTTHSNHFLDMALDFDNVAVFGVQQQAQRQDQTPRFSVEVLDRADETSLSLLGARTSSVFLVNATLWVEGVTDRLYLRRLLRLYQAQLPADAWRAEEDVHYSFVEYGGANVTHFNFDDTLEESAVNARRLCANAMVIADGDGGKNETRHAELRAMLGERFVVIPGREIENLLPPAIVGQTVAEYEKCEPGEVPSFSRSEYRDCYLGNFIENQLKAHNGMRRQGGYAEDSGTIKRKPDFCKRALSYMESDEIFETLAEDVRMLVERIHNFVRGKNENNER